MTVHPHKYCARYCEENVWHLVQEPAFAGSERAVALISNPVGACLFWDQRAGGGSDAPVWWDYHVILFVRDAGWRVFDLDTALPFPVDAATYLRRTFRMEDVMPPEFRPCFAIFEGAEYVGAFASDRSHMRDGKGGWLSPPPDWPPINGGCGEGFGAFVARQMKTGAHASLEEVRRRFGT